jgi:hypothetical protein
MVGAIWFVHWPDGFFLDHTGPRHGIEFNVALLGLALTLLLTGAGPLSLDGWLGLEETSSLASIESARERRSMGGVPTVISKALVWEARHVR